VIGFEEDLEVPRCSRAGCQEDARWRIDWRNPRIHTEERVKTWLACPGHVDYLREFLGARDFPLTVVPLEAAADPATAAGPVPS
jgi:translation elongation factor EF-Tu-like GTPase